MYNLIFLLRMLRECLLYSAKETLRLRADVSRAIASRRTDPTSVSFDLVRFPFSRIVWRQYLREDCYLKIRTYENIRVQLLQTMKQRLPTSRSCVVLWYFWYVVFLKKLGEKLKAENSHEYLETAVFAQFGTQTFDYAFDHMMRFGRSTIVKCDSCSDDMLFFYDSWCIV